MKTENVNNLCILLTTCASQAQATEIASQLLLQKLAACINIIPNIHSYYCWDEKVCNDQELQLVIKTKRQNISPLKSWLETNHPYDVPEILVLSVTDSSQAYGKWVQEVC